MNDRLEVSSAMLHKIATLVIFAFVLTSCQSPSVSEGQPTTLFGGFGVDPGPAYQQDDKPITKHQQYMGAGFQNQ